MKFAACLLDRTIDSRDSKGSWIALVALVLIQCLIFGLMTNFSLFYSALLLTYNNSKASTAWVGSIIMALILLLAPAASWLASRFGIRLSMMITAAICGLSMVLTSFANSLNFVYVTLSFLYGVGCSIAFMTTSRAINSYFNKRLSTAFGILLGVSSLLQIGLTPLIIELLDKYGLKITFRIYGVVSAVFCLCLSTLLFPTNYSKSPNESDKETSSQSKGIMEHISMLKSRSFCLWIAVRVIMFFGFAVPYVHQVQFGIESGVPEHTAKQFPLYTAVGAGIGRIASGYIFDRKMNKIYAFQALLFANSLTSLVGSFSTNQYHFIAFIWAYSLIDGLVQGSVFAVHRAVVGVEKFNEALSMVMMFSTVTMVLGPPLLGLVVDTTGNYNALFLFTGIPLFVAGLLLFGLPCMKEFHAYDPDYVKALAEDANALTSLEDDDDKNSFPLQLVTTI